MPLTKFALALKKNYMKIFLTKARPSKPISHLSTIPTSVSGSGTVSALSHIERRNNMHCFSIWPEQSRPHVKRLVYMYFTLTSVQNQFVPFLFISRRPSWLLYPTNCYWLSNKLKECSWTSQLEKIFERPVVLALFVFKQTILENLLFEGEIFFESISKRESFVILLARYFFYGFPL